PRTSSPELDRVASCLVALSAGRVQVAATVDSPPGTHLALTGPADAVDDLDGQVEIVTAQRAGRQALALGRTGAAPPRPAARPLTMEELVPGYLREPAARPVPQPGPGMAR